MTEAAKRHGLESVSGNDLIVDVEPSIALARDGVPLEMARAAKNILAEQSWVHAGAVAPRPLQPGSLGVLATNLHLFADFI